MPPPQLRQASNVSRLKLHLLRHRRTCNRFSRSIELQSNHLCSSPSNRLWTLSVIIASAATNSAALPDPIDLHHRGLRLSLPRCHPCSSGLKGDCTAKQLIYSCREAARDGRDCRRQVAKVACAPIFPDTSTRSYFEPLAPKYFSQLQAPHQLASCVLRCTHSPRQDQRPPRSPLEILQTCRMHQLPRRPLFEVWRQQGYFIRRVLACRFTRSPWDKRWKNYYRSIISKSDCLVRGIRCYVTSIGWTRTYRHSRLRRKVARDMGRIDQRAICFQDQYPASTAAGLVSPVASKASPTVIAAALASQDGVAPTVNSEAAA
jgi:hypothetical protein